MFKVCRDYYEYYRRRKMLLLLLLLTPCVLGEPHLELEEGDSPCLHKPCHHGVCVETNSLATGYKCFCQGTCYARK